MTRSLALIAAALITALAAGCSGGHSGHSSADAAPPANADHNAADVRFARDMIVHHAGALTMADDALSRGTAKIRPLAERIKAAQAPEIEKMSGWLRAWGEDVPAQDGGGNHHGMPGMASAADLDALGKSTGAEADRLFLTLMIAHHEGALEMAADEQKNGEYADAKKLAAEIVTAQRAEIAEMRAMQ